ncbi:hypothetical protein R3P38DRAFT_3218933 [Favolaschia claudopus]|uniref:F-box domain-containing protein n=1 Tax=Favolaschia claudopus TaxID=2862362 RepID=A0AAW0A3X7_9AGAR
MPPLSPIKRVPRDVLLELLGAAYEGSEFDWVNSVDDRTLLCLVCQEWNETIQTSAQFWRSVPITGMTSSSFIERQLGRSRQLDLNVFIHLTVFTLDRKLDLPSNCSLKGPVYIVRNLLPLLVPQIHRIATIAVECLNQTEWLHTVSVIRESHAPRLQSLSVSHYSATGPNVVLPAFDTTPPLSSLSISTSGVWMDMATYKELKTL